MSDYLWDNLTEHLEPYRESSRDLPSEFWITAASGEKRDVYQEVTDKVMESLDKGAVPWHKPWDVDGIEPTSVSSGRAYRGINRLLLGLQQQVAGHEIPHWATYKQIQEHGGQVRKGEKGTTVTYRKQWTVVDKDAPPPGPGEDPKTRTIPLLKTYTVFNVGQADGLSGDHCAKCNRIFNRVKRDPVETHPAVQKMIDEYAARGGPKITHGIGDRAFYRPSTDEITLPEKTQFSTPEGYASTVLHELTHSTGHESRLDRFKDTGEPNHFGSEKYAHEELVAELGNAFLRGHAGIKSDTEHEQSTAYIHGWLHALGDDKTLVVKAAGKAQKAADHILGIQPETFNSEDSHTASIYSSDKPFWEAESDYKKDPFAPFWEKEKNLRRMMPGDAARIVKKDVFAPQFTKDKFKDPFDEE